MLQEILKNVPIGVGLAMDAFAVSVVIGCTTRLGVFQWRKVLLAAVLFGLFQTAMPLIGYAGGVLAGEIVRRFGRVVAAVLLSIVGGKMLLERGDSPKKRSFSFRDLLILAFATSIDALFVGLAFACLDEQNVGTAVVTIGVVTALICLGGGWAGSLFGKWAGRRSSLLGGAILLIIAVKILFFG